MARQFLGFGNGQDGDLVISSNITDSPIDSSCSGTIGTKTLTVGNGLSFQPGQIVKIHQSRGTGAGNWELNQVDSYSGTTLTLKYDLENTYTDSGASQAQVLVVKQYKSIKINSGNTLTAKAWDGNVGGIIAIACKGRVTIDGTIDASQKGFLGGTGSIGVTTAQTGEGTAGAQTNSTAANGNGGGASRDDASGAGYYAGGGGSNRTAGEAGTGGGSGAAGSPGSTVGDDSATSANFGGGGGGQAVAGGTVTAAGNGGIGGGLVLIFTREIVVTGFIKANGGQGTTGLDNGVTPLGGGGGGAGGIILIRAASATLGTSLVQATGGPQSTDNGSGTHGGAGGNGLVRVETCSLLGTTNPSASQVVGGHKWCGSGTMVM